VEWIHLLIFPFAVNDLSVCAHFFYVLYICICFTTKKFVFFTAWLDEVITYFVWFGDLPVHSATNVGEWRLYFP